MSTPIDLRGSTLMESMKTLALQLPQDGDRIALMDEFPIVANALLSNALTQLRDAENPFGAIGDAIPIMSDGDFIRVLPTALVACISSGEPIFAVTVMRRLIECCNRYPHFALSLKELPSTDRELLVQLVSMSSEIGWGGEKRGAAAMKLIEQLLDDAKGNL